jgi:hypothetical protein
MVDCNIKRLELGLGDNLEPEGVEVVVGDIIGLASWDADIQVHSLIKLIAQEAIQTNVRNVQNDIVGEASLVEPFIGIEISLNLEGWNISVIRFEKSEGDALSVSRVGNQLERSIRSIKTLTELDAAIVFTIYEKSGYSIEVGIWSALGKVSRVMSPVINQRESSLNRTAISIE